MNNLRKIRQLRGISQADLAEKLKSKSGNKLISGYELEVNKMSSEVVTKLAEFLNCSVGQILGTEPIDNLISSSFLTTKDDKDAIEVPLYNIKAAAGDGYLIDTCEYTEALINFKKGFFESMVKMNPKNARFLQIEGSSMEPKFKSGDYVLVDISIKTPNSGSIYLIREGDYMKVKRIFVDYLNQTVRISSDNPNKALYPDIEASLDKLDRIEIIGLVRWATWKLEF